VDGAVPLEVGGGGEAELVGEVAPLVVVLPVLVLVEVGLCAEGLTTDAADELLLNICLEL